MLIDILKHVGENHLPQWAKQGLADLRHIKKELETMSKDFDDLKAEVKKEITLSGSLITLFTGVKTQLDAALATLAAGDDGEALRTLSADLGENTSKLAAFVAANTPAAQVPPAPDPVPAPAPPTTA